jgi:DNA-binding HxlR family transcriptional regulator
LRLVFSRLQDYNIAVKRKRKVSTLLCHSYPKETIVKKWGFFMEKNLPACPVETTLMLISDRWKVLIIRDLLEGTKRFGELKKSVGNVSQKVLTANLRSMEDSGLLTRKVYPEVPPRVEYTLTETGYSLKSILDAMVEWGTEYKKKNS